ncbi:MAG TPA: Yip1 family protein, partial [Anaerolineales bacterium]
MSEATLSQVERRKRIHLEWVLPVLFRPRSAFQKIAEQTRAVWLTPMLILSLAILAQVLIAGPTKQAAAQSGAGALPQDFQYYSPEQQAQFLQAQQATSSPVFIYAFPSITGLAGVWVGWLLVSGLIHLVLTLLGGRGDMGAALNVVAWSGLPYAIRALVRGGYILAAHHLVTTPGLSGFVPQGQAYL